MMSKKTAISPPNWIHKMEWQFEALEKSFCEGRQIRRTILGLFCDQGAIPMLMTGYSLEDHDGFEDEGNRQLMKDA